MDVDADVAAADANAGVIYACEPLWVSLALIHISGFFESLSSPLAAT